MKCPHCGSMKSRVIDTKVNKRMRNCSECGATFPTFECTAVLAGKDAEYFIDTSAKQFQGEALMILQPEMKPYKAQQRQNKWHPARVNGELTGMDPEVAELMQVWWNESRWSKLRTKATWTERAWLSSVERVKELPLERQLALVKAGVEQGWQALKPEYLSPSDMPVSSAPGPRNEAMLAALDSWQD